MFFTDSTYRIITLDINIRNEQINSFKEISIFEVEILGVV